MLSLGLLSLIQIWFLPGMLALLAIPRLNKFDKFLLCVPLSLFLNYVLVVTLVWIGMYTQPAVLAIIAVEVLTLALAYMRQRRGKLTNRADESVSCASVALSPANILVGVSFLTYLILASKYFGSVFEYWDVVVSWNRWANDWASGVAAQSTGHYPQLLPCIYSLTYTVIDETRVQFFARLSVFIFPLLSLGMLLRCSFLCKEYSQQIKLGLVFFAWLMLVLLGEKMLYSGMADIAIAYYTILAGYILLLLDKDESLNGGAPIVLLTIAVAGAGAVKQAGLFLAVLFPVVWFLYCGNNRLTRNAVATLKLMVVTLVICVMPWYLYEEIRIANHLDASNIAYVTSLVKLAWYYKLLLGFGSKLLGWASFIVMPLFFLGLCTPVGKRIAFWVVIPFYILWALFFSYDPRNFALAIPALALVLGFGMQRLIVMTRPHRELMVKAVCVGLSLCVALAVIAMSTGKLSNKLLNKSISQQKDFGEPRLNTLLYNYFDHHLAPGLVITSYIHFMALPEMKERNLRADCKTPQPFINQMESNSDVRYALVSSSCAEVISYMRECVVAGRAEEVFRYEGQTFEGQVFYHLMK